MSRIKNNFIINYLVGSWSEIKKVSWPKREEVINHTLIVMISCGIAIAITSAIDYGLTYVVQYIVQRRG
jgi:preprotein translocase SecE subunit